MEQDLLSIPEDLRSPQISWGSCCSVFKIENELRECIKEKTTQLNASNGSLTQRVNPAPGGRLQRVPKHKWVLVSCKWTSY